MLMVCKDMGAANIIVPIARELLHVGHEVIPITEGLGANLWPKTGQMQPIFRGTDYHTVIPFSLDVQAVLEHYRPHVVVVGESFPNNLEGQFARAAQQKGLPLVLVEDFWGGFVRIGGLTKSPELILTLDEYAARLIQEQFPEASVVIVGNPGVQNKNILHALEVVTIRHDGFWVITLCGGGPETGEQIKLLLECLAITSGEWKLIPRWHPKVADLSDPATNRPYRETWDRLLEPLGDRVVHVDGPATESVVVASHLVVAGFSTLLTTAAKAGVAAAALVTPAVQESLQEESGLHQIPHVELGVAHLVTTAVNLALSKPCTQEVRDRLMPLNPVLGAEQICALVEGR